MSKLSWDDKTWLWANKKPSGKWSTYFYGRVLWVGVGLFVGLAFYSANSGTTANTLGAITSLLVSVIFGWTAIWSDKKKGYVDAEQKHYLEVFNKRLSGINDKKAK